MTWMTALILLQPGCGSFAGMTWIQEESKLAVIHSASGNPQLEDETRACSAT